MATKQVLLLLSAKESHIQTFSELTNSDIYYQASYKDAVLTLKNDRSIAYVLICDEYAEEAFQQDIEQVKKLHNKVFFIRNTADITAFGTTYYAELEGHQSLFKQPETSTQQNPHSIDTTVGDLPDSAEVYDKYKLLLVSVTPQTIAMLRCFKQLVTVTNPLSAQQELGIESFHAVIWDLPGEKIVTEGTPVYVWQHDFTALKELIGYLEAGLMYSGPVTRQAPVIATTEQTDSDSDAPSQLLEPTENLSASQPSPPNNNEHAEWQGRAIDENTVGSAQNGLTGVKTAIRRQYDAWRPTAHKSRMSEQRLRALAGQDEEAETGYLWIAAMLAGVIFLICTVALLAYLLFVA